MGKMTTTDRPTFEMRSFFAALDAERRSRNLNWKEVAAEAGISASTLTRMSQGRRPDVDGLASLLAWSGLEMSDYIRQEVPERHPETLARISTQIRADPRLSDESATALEQIITAAYQQMAGRPTDTPAPVARSDGG
jgi:transcriptional regulator with XRE-family HTH domain